MAASDPLVKGDLAHSLTSLLPVLLDTKQGETHVEHMVRAARMVPGSWYLVPVLAKLC